MSLRVAFFFCKISVDPFNLRSVRLRKSTIRKFGFSTFDLLAAVTQHTMTTQSYYDTTQIADLNSGRDLCRNGKDQGQPSFSPETLSVLSSALEDLQIILQKLAASAANLLRMLLHQSNNRSVISIIQLTYQITSGSSVV
jgi:hypothetical protein